MSIPNFTSNLKSMESNHKPLVVLRCKLVIVGDACVGKTALSQVFSSGGSTYPKNYMMTIGAEFCVKQVPIPEASVIVELYIFDCGGQSIFNQVEMNAKYFENASAVMVVYDISKRDSFQSANKWLSAVRNIRPAGPQLLGVLVGNKSEYRDGSIESRAEVVKEDAQRAASELGLAYFETSAVNNNGIEEPFKYVAHDFYKRYIDAIRRAQDLGSTLA